MATSSWWVPVRLEFPPGTDDARLFRWDFSHLQLEVVGLRVKFGMRHVRELGASGGDTMGNVTMGEGAPGIGACIDAKLGDGAWKAMDGYLEVALMRLGELSNKLVTVGNKSP